MNFHRLMAPFLLINSFLWLSGYTFISPLDVHSSRSGVALFAPSTSNAPPSLKTLTLTTADLDSVWRGFAENAKERDVSDELKTICQLECTKILWEVPREGVRLTLFMIRTPSSQSASKAANSLWKTYTALGKRFHSDILEAEATNGWWAIVDYAERGKFQHIVAKAHGPVFVLLIHQLILRSFVVDIDSYGYVLDLQTMMETQIGKLEQVGYAP